MALMHSATIPSHPQANLSGWFERHTSLWPVRRWLELRGPTLTYRHSRSGPAQWTVDLRECRVAAGSRARELMLERPSEPRLSLFAPTLAELKLWFTELKRVSDGIHDFYFLAAQISHSAHGPIVLGREKISDEQAAVFLQRKADMSAWTMWALTRRDQRVLRLSQSHPSTVHVRDVFETTRIFYVVTELVTGGPLRDALTRAGCGAAAAAVPLPPPSPRPRSAMSKSMSSLPARTIQSTMPTPPLGHAVALSVTSDVLRALAHLHAGGVVHGCVDASHVLCAGGLPGRVKLVVFGVAAGAREAAAFGRGPGVLGDAPEVVCFRRRSWASDVFSAGVLLFELLTGERPFGAGTASEEEFLANVSKGAPTHAQQPLSSWHRLGAARSLLERMLHEDPAKRPTAQECLKHEWFDGVFISNSVSATTATSNSTRTHPLARWGSDPKTVILDFEQNEEQQQERGRVSQETDAMDDGDDRSDGPFGHDSDDDGMDNTIPTVDEDEDEDEDGNNNTRLDLEAINKVKKIGLQNTNRVAAASSGGARIYNK